MTSVDDQLGSIHDRISRVFEGALSLEAPAPDVDLIDSGLLDSLAIVSLIAALEEEFAIAVPLEQLDLAHLRTIAAISHLVTGDGSPESATESGLVALASGDETRPVFLFPGVTGEALGMLALTRRLTSPRAIYGLEAWGSPAHRAQPASIEQRGERSLQAMRAFQSRGPYTLIGFSFGGLVAYEVACRLRAAGESVAGLALIDTRADPRALSPAGYRRYRLTIPWRGARLILSDPVRWIPHYGRSLTGRRLPAAAVAPAVEPAADRTGFTAHETERGDRAAADYRPPRYDGDVTLFAIPDRHPADCGPRMIWRDRVRGRLQIKAVPGPHSDILGAPNVSLVATEVDALLR